jgi:hypothetical protein
VDGNGKTIVADADVDMKVPAGGKFIPAPMRYFMRFHEADGMHAGYLPGYPASHGCVRMPEAIGDCVLTGAVEIGTPVTVFGRTPRANEYSPYGLGGPNRRNAAMVWATSWIPDFNPQYDPRYLDPWWR